MIRLALAFLVLFSGCASLERTSGPDPIADAGTSSDAPDPADASTTPDAAECPPDAPPPPPPPPTCECECDDDCSTGETCRHGTCYERCDCDADCDAGEECRYGACKPDQ